MSGYKPFLDEKLLWLGVGENDESETLHDKNLLIQQDYMRGFVDQTASNSLNTLENKRRLHLVKEMASRQRINQLHLTQADQRAYLAQKHASNQNIGRRPYTETALKHSIKRSLALRQKPRHVVRGIEHEENKGELKKKKRRSRKMVTSKQVFTNELGFAGSKSSLGDMKVLLTSSHSHAALQTPASASAGVVHRSQSSGTLLAQRNARPSSSPGKIRSPMKVKTYVPRWGETSSSIMKRRPQTATSQRRIVSSKAARPGSAMMRLKQRSGAPCGSDYRRDAAPLFLVEGSSIGISQQYAPAPVQVSVPKETKKRIIKRAKSATSVRHKKKGSSTKAERLRDALYDKASDKTSALRSYKLYRYENDVPMVTIQIAGSHSKENRHHIVSPKKLDQ